MKLFLHTPAYIRIINEAKTPAEFSCVPDQFYTLEPAYPPLLDGMSGRYWTPETHYTTDGQTQYPEETFDGSPYCDKVDLYQLPSIFADVQIGQDRLCNNSDPPDNITFQAWIKDAQGTVLPVNESWIIRLRDADEEEADAFEVNFTNGATVEMLYTCPPTINLGRIHVDESDFAPVTVPGVGTFQVKLMSPVEFTIYRQL